MRSSTTTAHGVLRRAGLGALLGLAAALGLVYLPIVLADVSSYEHTDALFVFVVVLVPLGAGIGALWATMRRPVGTARSGPWIIAAWVRGTAVRRT